MKTITIKKANDPQLFTAMLYLAINYAPYEKHRTVFMDGLVAYNPALQQAITDGYLSTKGGLYHTITGKGLTKPNARTKELTAVTIKSLINSCIEYEKTI